MEERVAWETCEDIEVLGDDGIVLCTGPKYFRCTRPECNLLVTRGMIATGGCWCGNRRLKPAIRLLKEERERLRQGYYPLVEWECRLIAPTLPDGKGFGWGKALWVEGA